MSKDKIADYDGATAGNNTDIGGISIDEGMLPSTVNNSMRELTRQLGAFADGTDGIDVLNLHDDDASASIKIQAPATVTTTTTFTLPDGDGTSGYALVTNGSGQLSWASAAGIGNIVEDTSPQLGGALDVNGNSITSASNGDITIDPNGTGDIVLDAKVGISTTSPESALQVTGAVNTTPDSSGVHLGMDSNYATIELAGSDGGQLDFPNAANTDYRGRIRYTASDNKMAFFASGAGTQTMTVTNTSVGIGTSSPTLDGSLAGLSVNGSGTVLHVNDGDGATLKLTDPATGANRGLGITLQGTSAAISNCESGELRFGTGNTERMRLDSSGNLLVGNSTFGAEDGVYISQGGNYVWARSDDTSGYFDRTGSDGKILELRKDGTTVGSIKAGNGDLLIGTGAVNLRFFDTTPAVIPRTASDGTSTGVVDLGNTSNKFKDGYFAGNIRTDSTIFAPSLTCYPNGSAPNADAAIYRPQDGTLGFVSNGSERGRFDSSGNLLVGKTTEGAGNVGFQARPDGFFAGTRSGGTVSYLNRLSNEGEILRFQKDSSTRGSITSSSSGVTYNTTSDIRLKQDIEPLAATDKLMAMNPVSYSWKADPDGPRSMGFIAQEMQEVMPEAVSTGDDEDAMMSMDYGRITPILVSALQDAHRKIEQLEQRLADMENN